MTLLDYCKENNIDIILPKDNSTNLIFWRIIKGEPINKYIVPFGCENIVGNNNTFFLSSYIIGELKKHMLKSKIKLINELSLMILMLSNDNENNFKISKNHWCYLDAKTYKWKILSKSEWKKIYIETRLKQYDDIINREELIVKLEENNKEFDDFVEENDEKDEQKVENTSFIKYKNRRKVTSSDYEFY
jgi:hypothetical protein